MEQPDRIENLLDSFFNSQREEAVIEKALHIHALQKAIKHQTTESNTLWRLIVDSFREAHVDPNELAGLANISNEEAYYIINEIRPEPFALPSAAMANILITFNISIKKLEALLTNALIAKLASKTSQRAVARSSETIGNTERARTMQDGLNALFIQVNKETPIRIDALQNKLQPDDQKKLQTYISTVTIELKKLDAEYLLL